MAIATSLSIDVYNCHPIILRSREKLQDYIIQLTKILDIERIDDCQIISYADQEITGHTVIQVIKNGLITAHFKSNLESAFIDIFSCCEIKESEAANFTQTYFISDKCITSNVMRSEGFYE